MNGKPQRTKRVTKVTTNQEPKSPGPITWAKLENFTVLRSFEESFSVGINLIVGENGAGKSHFLRALYAMQCAPFDQEAVKEFDDSEDLLFWIPRIWQAFSRPGSSLISFHEDNARISVIFHSAGSYTVSLKDRWISAYHPLKKVDFDDSLRPKFLDTTEIVSRVSWIVGVVRRFKDPKVSSLQVDLAEALLAPNLNDPFVNGAMLSIFDRIAEAIDAVPSFSDNNEVIMSLGMRRKRNASDSSDELVSDRSVEITKPKFREVAIALAAEGHRKLAQVMILLMNGSITPGMTLYWDEPETNLNPKLLRLVAEVLVDLAVAGVQVFVATHSFFLMKEVDLLLLRKREELGIVPPEDGSPDKLGRFFAFRLEDGAVAVERGHTLTDIDTIASLDAELDQEDRAQRYYWAKATERKQP